jgi:hypothetical protein
VQVLSSRRSAARPVVLALLGGSAAVVLAVQALPASANSSPTVSPRPVPTVSPRPVPANVSPRPVPAKPGAAASIDTSTKVQPAPVPTPVPGTASFTG